MLKSCEGARLGDGAVVGGGDGCIGADLLENGLERIVAGGLLKPNDGLEGDIERGALGVNDGLEGVNEGDLPGLNDGLEGVNEGDLPGLNDGPEGAIDDDLPELNGATELLEGPGLGLDLMAWPPAPLLLRAELRSEPPRPAMRLGFTWEMLDDRRLAGERAV